MRGNKTLLKNMLRGVEKMPGINLLEIANFGEKNILMFPKVGTRSIRNTLLIYHNLGNNRAAAWQKIDYCTKKTFQNDLNHKETFVILRSPIERLHSCWKQKISHFRDDGFFYYFQYFPLLRPNMSFLNFLEAISSLPTGMFEKHFIPIDYFLPRKSKLKYTFVPLDKLDETFSLLLGSCEKVERANATGFSTISAEELDFFTAHLLWRFARDEELFRRYSQ